ncbi:MAG: META domain-containing protein [Xanthomonadales bacterium]|nr:META domain-containing protein [Xanthomonadales bacterium]
MKRLLILSVTAAVAACGGQSPSAPEDGSEPTVAQTPASEPAPPPANASGTTQPEDAGAPSAGQNDAAMPTYSGFGNEPGWRVDISNDQLAISLDYGHSQISGPLPALQELADDGRRYQAQIGDHAVQVDIHPGLCVDDMSGMPRPDQMELQVDGRQFSGCAGDPRDLLADGEWRVLELDGQAINEGQNGSLLFDRDDRVSGRAFCNRFSAGYTLTGEGLTIGPAAATKMACEAEAMALEQRFLALIGQVSRFAIDDGDLILHTATGAALRARR